MSIKLQSRLFWKKGWVNILIILAISLCFPLFGQKDNFQTNPELSNASAFLFLEKNSLLAVYNPNLPKGTKIAKKIPVIITAYSSTPWQTDSDPFITASNTWVKEGIVANNALPFGTKVKFPEIYGDKIFIVEDRMHWRKSHNHFDIWFPEYQQALNFGAKRTEGEILEN